MRLEDTLKAEFESIAQSGAMRIGKAMDQASRESYINFVSMLYHYSVPGEPQLSKASKSSPTKAMRDFYAELAEEEANHDIIAIRDMKVLGCKIGPEDELVKDYHSHWDHFNEDKTYEYLGMNAVIENSIHYLSDKVDEMIDRLGLGKEETRWIRIHAEVDKSHGAEAMECACGHVNESNYDLMIKGAREDMERFTAMFVAALTKHNPLPAISAS